MIRQLLPILILSAMLAGCSDRREPVRPTKPRTHTSPPTVRAEPSKTPADVEEKSPHGLPMVIQLDDLPEIPEGLLGPSPPIEKEKKG